jgi:hypothetical protein
MMIREAQERYDVIVCGGGPAGFTAAIAAAESGAKVLLVERKHQLGGVGTSGLVSHWLGGRSDDGGWKIGGIFRRFSLESARLGISVIIDPAAYAQRKYSPYAAYKGQLLVGIPFNPDAMAQFIEEQCIATGVTVLYETALCAAETEGNSIMRIVTAAKDGLTARTATCYVDATGDADLAAFGGATFVKGLENDGFMSAASVMFHIDNVDEAALLQYYETTDDVRFRNLLATLRSEGEECFDYEIVIFVKMNRDGHFMVNGRGLKGVDGTDPASRTEAFVKDRARIRKTFDQFRRRFPGMKNAILKAVAGDLGVRETRRIEGCASLTVADVQSAKAWPDTIGLSSYGWDLHGKYKTQPMHGAPKPPFTPIPYRIMVPRSLGNVICPGRAVSVERDVLGPLRVQAPVMAMGEAAGVAAARLCRGNSAKKSFADIDTAGLKKDLLKRGGILE